MRKYWNLVCAHGVNVLDDNIDTIKKNRASLLEASREVDLDVNRED